MLAVVEYVTVTHTVSPAGMLAEPGVTVPQDTGPLVLQVNDGVFDVVLVLMTWNGTVNGPVDGSGWDRRRAR